MKALDSKRSTREMMAGLALTLQISNNSDKDVPCPICPISSVWGGGRFDTFRYHSVHLLHFCEALYLHQIRPLTDPKAHTNVPES